MQKIDSEKVDNINYGMEEEILRFSILPLKDKVHPSGIALVGFFVFSQAVPLGRIRLYPFTLHIIRAPPCRIEDSLNCQIKVLL